MFHSVDQISTGLKCVAVETIGQNPTEEVDY